MLKIKTLEETTLESITETFNHAFSDFDPQIKFTKEKFKDKFSTEGGRLDLSVGVFDKDKLVAFILHFVDVKNGEKYIYNGGTGVTQSYRGNRLTTKMYDFILPKLKEEHVDNMILEVFTDNYSAQKVYQSQGFKVMRELACYKGKLITSTEPKLKQDHKIVVLQDLDWNRLQSFWDYEPSWQNSISTMNNLQKQNLCLGINLKDEIVGYLIYNPTFKRINQMAIDKPYRNLGLGSHLLNHIASLEKDDISFINIDTRMKHFKVFLERRGLINFVNQNEMEFKLK